MLPLTGARKLTYKSGHHNNVFQARFLPHSNNSTIVTCAADGQVSLSPALIGAKLAAESLATLKACFLAGEGRVPAW